MNARTLTAAAGLALALGSATHTAHAQIGIGVRAGVLVADETFDDFGDKTINQLTSTSGTGFTVGIPIEIALSKVIALQPEINYQRRESSFTNTFRFNEVTTTQEFERKLNYVEVPLLLKLGYTSDNFTLAGVAGPSFGYALTGTQTYSDYLVDGRPLGEVEPGVGNIGDTNFERDRVDWNGVLGAQLGLPLASGKLIFDGRYQFGLNSLKNGDTTINQALDDVTSKSQGYSFTLGYMLTLGNY